jgi:hypothetical protein
VSVPLRQVRAVHDEQSLVVYQAYPPVIAERALRAGTFVAPFKRDRMTWIKPSFLWMMYRSGWAQKPGQERVLAVTITRAGLEWALSHACLSDYEPDIHGSHEAWRERKLAAPVRVQWDPERSIRLERLEHRAIQIGLGGDSVVRYVEEWIVGLADVTPLAHEIQALVAAGKLDAASSRLPDERPLRLSTVAAATVGVAGVTSAASSRRGCPPT